MSYVKNIVAVRDFDIAEVRTFSVGHAHEDVDQCFSQSSGLLRRYDAITLQDLHFHLRHTNKGTVNVSNFKPFANFLGSCKVHGCLNRVENIAQHWYSKFSRMLRHCSDAKDGRVRAVGHVITKCCYRWKLLFLCHCGKTGN